MPVTLTPAVATHSLRHTLTLSHPRDQTGLLQVVPQLESIAVGDQTRIGQIAACPTERLATSVGRSVSQTAVGAAVSGRPECEWLTDPHCRASFDRAVAEPRHP